MSLSPINWCVSIVDSAGRALPQFQRVFNSLINFGPSITQDDNNQLSLSRGGDFYNSGQVITSTSYTDVSPIGPIVTQETGTSALVIICATATNVGSIEEFALISIDVSGATTMAPTDNNGTSCRMPVAAQASLTRAIILTGLTPGANTFTLKYRVTGSSYNISQQSMIVIPL